MENALKIFRNNAAVAIFCIALAVWISVNNNLNKLLFTTKETVLDNDILYQSEEVSEQDEISYEELISTIMIGQDYDIQIDRMLLQAKEFNYLQFDYNLITYCRYKQQIIFNNDGSINRIIYSSIN